MSLKILSAIFGSSNSRQLKRIGKVVKKINALEEGYEKLSDEEIKAKTTEFRERFEKNHVVRLRA